MLGQTLGHYLIESKLGEGGMGAVWKARDIRLDRFVALKTLPAEKLADAERRRRFAQEAKAASALNHPNIVHIYDIADADAVPFIAMEYVAGKTLDQLIGRKGLRVGESLKYAVQIADALARAHAAGIIHRDLKPSNIIVDEHGLVKVLDFGLAKLTETVAGELGETATVRAPEGPGTEEGTILGTTAYMSPEQAEGKEVDARSDIFSFGSVLYEMVTGRRAFHGDSKLSTLSAILKDDPKPVSSIMPDAPRDLDKIISRCLRKDAERRFQTMADLKVALTELKEESEAGKLAAAVVQPRSRRRRFVWPLGAAVAVVAVAAAAIWYMNTSLREAILTPVPLTTYPGFEGNASFSPDGIQVAFSWCKEEGTPTWHAEYPNICNIYVKQIGVEPPSRLTDTMAKDFSPAWSPDGKWIAFLRLASSTKLALILVPQRGGRERVVLEHDLKGLAEMPQGPHVAWTPDSRWIVCTTPGREDWFLSLVAVDSAEKRVLTKPSGTGLGDTAPSISPDGRMLAFSRHQERYDLYKLRLSEQYAPQGEPQKLPSEDPPNLGAAWLPGGNGIVFASKWGGENGLWRTSASGGGRPQRLPFAPTFATEPAVSRRGNRLAYTVYRNDSNIWRVELLGPGRKPSAPARVISSTRREGGPACSPDGKRLAFVSDQSGAKEVWLCDLDGSNPQQLTSLGGTMIDLPQWSPDGQNIAVTIFEGGKKKTLGVISANSGALRRLPGEGKWPSWSRDGQWLYFALDRAPQGIWKMRPYGGGAPVQITHGSGDDMPQASPDGKFIYYQRGWPGPLSILRTPVEGGEETKIIEGVSGGGLWTVGADGIYFFTTPDAKGRSEIRLYVFATGRATKILTVERSVGFKIAVSPGGRSIFYPQYDEQGSDLMLVENFR